MAKRSSNLKQKVHNLCENIQPIKTLTENSTASFEYHDKAKWSSKFSWNKGKICGWEVGTVQKFFGIYEIEDYTKVQAS